MANSCCGDESTCFLRLSQWSQALCQGNPILHSQKNSAWFTLPAHLRILSALPAKLGKMKPACQGNGPCTKAWILLPPQGPGVRHLCSNANSCFLGFGVLQMSLKYNKTGSQYFHITAQSWWQTPFLWLVCFVRSYSICLDSFSSSYDPLLLSWLKASEIQVIQICLTQTPKSFTKCNFIEENCLLLWAGSAMFPLVNPQC